MPSLKELYDALKADNAPVPEKYEAFESYMTSGPNGGYDHRKEVYNALKADGVPLPDTYEQFSSALFSPAPKRVEANPPVEVERNPWEATVSDPLSRELNQRESPESEFTPEVAPAQPAWQPTEAEKNKKAYEAQQVIDRFNNKSQSMLDDSRRMTDSFTPEGRKSVKVMADSAKLVGAEVSAPKFGPGEQRAQMTAGESAEQSAYAPVAPRVAGVTFMDGKPVTQWMLPDGSVTTDPSQVGAAEENARNFRLQHEYERRMRENGLDPASELDQSLAEAYDKNKRLEEEISRRKGELDKEHESGSFWQKTLKALSGAAQSGKDAHAMRDDADSRNYSGDKEYNMLTAALRNNRAQINILEDKKAGEMNEFWLSMGKQMVDGYTFNGGLSELNDARALTEASTMADEINRKNQSGERLTDEEAVAEMLLSTLAKRTYAEEKYGDEYGVLARAGKMGAHSIELLPDFALGGMSLMEKTVGKTLGKMGVKEVTNAVNRNLLKATGVTLGTLGGGALMTNTIGLPRVMAEASKRASGNVYTDDNGDYVIDGKDGVLTAFLKAERDMIAENASEAVGAFMPGLGRIAGNAMNKIGLSKLSKGISTLKGKGWYQATNNALEKMGFNGTINEAMEEYAGAGYSLIMGDTEPLSSMADPRTHVDIWLGCATLGAILNVPQYAGTGVYGIKYLQQKRKLGKSEANAASVVKNSWDELKLRFEATSNDEMANLATEILCSNEYTPEEREAIADYVLQLQRFRGYNLGETIVNKEPADEEISAIDAEIEQNYQTGVDAADNVMGADPVVAQQAQAQIQDISSRMEQAYSDFFDAFGSSAEVDISIADENPLEIINREELSEDQRQAAINYVNARAAMLGATEAAEDNKESKSKTVERTVKERTNHETGMILPATMKADDRQVYVVSGNVVMSSDGTTIDAQNSDKSIVIRDAQSGELSFTSPDRIQTVGENIDPQQELDAAYAAIEQEQAVIFENSATESDENNGSDGDNGSNVTDVADASDEANRADGAEVAENEGGEPQTALSRIPVNEQGKPEFTGVEAEVAWDALVEKTQDDESAQRFADSQVKRSKANLEKAQKAKIKDTDDIDEFVMLDNERKAAIAQAQAQYDAWQKIAGERQRRQDVMEAEARARQEEEQREAELAAQAEAQWQQDKKKFDKRLRETAEEVRNVPEALAVLENMEPQTIDEVAAYILSFQKVVWGDTKRNGRMLKYGVKGHVGIGEEERRRLFGLFASEANGGMTIDQLAEDYFKEMCRDFRVPYDNAEARNALIDIIRGSMTIGDIRNYIANRRIEQARKIAADYNAYEERMNDEFYKENYHMGYREYEDYEQQLEETAIAALENLDETEYYGNIADEIIQRQQEEDELRRNQESVAEGESESSSRGDEVLPPSQSIEARGDEESAEPGAGRGSENRSEVPDTSGSLPESTSSGAVEPPEPTEAQKAAGNYKMEHRRIDGYNISIENPKGSVRRGVGADGKPWETLMHNDYGYIRGTEGVDGDHIDVFLSDTPEQGDVFVVDQINADGSFDEHKVMYGFPTEEAAREAYLSNYDEGWAGLGAITHVSKEEFRKWVESSRRKTKPFAEYKSVKAITEDVDQTRTNVNAEGMVVDSEGNPLTLYHGTPNDVEALSDLEAGHHRKGEDEPARFNGDGISFTPHRDVAEDYASLGDGNNGKVFEANVILKNPYYTVGVANFTSEEAAEFTASLKAKGHDGIINYASQSMRQMGTDPNEVIVFDIKSAKPIEGNGMIGRSLTEQEATELIERMEAAAEVAPEIELTIKNWDAQFGIDGEITTPIGVVKMGEHQFAKLMRHGRNGKLGMIKPTLENPYIIIEDGSVAKEGEVSERSSSYVFVKSFRKSDGSRYYYFTSITVSKDGKEVVISSQEKNRNRILRLMQEGSVVWCTPKDATTSSAEKQGLDYEQPDKAEATAKGSGITPQNTPSDGKDNSLSTEKQVVGAESSEGANRNNRNDRSNLNDEPTVSEIEAASRAADEAKADEQRTIEESYGESLDVSPEDAEKVQADMDGLRADTERQVEPTAEMTEGERDASTVNSTLDVAEVANRADGADEADAPVVFERNRKIEGLEKLPVNKRVKAEDFVRNHNSVPIIVVKSEADIDALELRDEVKAALKDRMSVGHISGLYNGFDKRIYIFATAGQKKPIRKVLLHENIHAAIDSMGDEAQVHLERFAERIGNLPREEGGFNALYSQVKENYKPQEVPNEYFTYIMTDVYRYPEFMDILNRHLNGPTIDFINRIKDKIYGNVEGRDSETEGNAGEVSAIDNGSGRTAREANSTPGDGDGGGLGRTGGEDEGSEKRGAGEAQKEEESGGLRTAGGRASQHEGRRASQGESEIEDFGEKIAGARKDMLAALSRDFGNLTARALVELPLSKAVKRPDFNKALETGAMTPEEANVAEALWQTVYSEKKPAATKRNTADIKKWADSTYQKIKRLQEFVEADAQRRNEIAQSLREMRPADEKSERAEFERILLLNSGRKFDEPVFTPDTAAVSLEVMRRMGVAPGEKVTVSFRIAVSRTKQYYEVVAANGNRLMIPATRDLQEAIEWITIAARMTRGDADIIYPGECFRVYGKNPIMEPSGIYEVGWLGGRHGYDYKSKEFKSEEEADKYAASLKEKGIESRKFEKQRNSGRYETYRIKFVDPISREPRELPASYETKEDARLAIAEKGEALSSEVNELIAKEKGAKKQPKEHYYVTRIYKRDSVVYAVCRNNVGQQDWLYSPVVKEFGSRDEAQAWFKENKDKLESGYEDFLKKRREFVYFDQKSQPRQGKDYRGGTDVTPEMFSEAFGFRGVQFGNWTNGADRQAALNEAYDAFMDLAEVTGLSPRALSLNGELGLAFGARGSGSANAHYESDEVVINLTKTRGAGSLAHEWWHALDNYFMRKEGVAHGFATTMTSENMRPELAGAFKELTEAINKSEFGRRSDLKGEYWGRMAEKTARLFGEWVVLKQQRQSARNHFLSRGIDESTIDMYRNLAYFYHVSLCRDKEIEPMSREEFAKSKEALMGFPYPTPEELNALDGYIQAVFDNLHQETTGGGIILSDRSEAYARRRATRRSEAPSTASLFDFDFNQEKETDSEADLLNTRIDEFTRLTADFLAVPEELLTEEMVDDMLRERQRMKADAERYYANHGSTEQEAKERANELVAKLQAQVSVVTARKNDAQRFAPTVAPHAKVTHRTAGGEVIRFEGSTGLLPKLSDGEYTLVERRFAINGGFDFSGRTTIESADDVAYIFRSLESYGTEQAFGVLVKDGKPMVIHLGSGSATASLVDLSPLRVAYDMLGGAEQVYLVHNHPSGNLKASPQDVTLQKRLELMFPGKVQDAIIMDTTRGLYGTFNSDSKMTEEKRAESNGETVALPVHSFVSQVFADGFDFESLATVKGSADVARLVAGQRLGASDKTGVLLLNNMNKVVGNILCSQSINSKELPRQIADYALAGGATRVAFYGRQENRSLPLRELGEQIGRLSGGSVSVIDVISVKNHGYESAFDNGLLEPQAEYGGKEADKSSDETIFRQGEGAFNDSEVSFEGDPTSRVLGKNRFSKKRQAEYAARERKRMADRVQSLVKRLHLDNVEIVTDTSQLEGKRATAKGFFNRSTGKITIVIPNHISTIDAEQTLLHETVAHYGLRKLFGSHFNTFLDNVYKSADVEIRRKIAAMAAKNGWDFRTATEEYLASLAEDTNFDETKEYSGWWANIKNLFLDMLEKIGFEGFRDKTGIVLSDNELRYILWRSYQNLAEPGRLRNIFGEAEDIAKQFKMKVGNYVEHGIEAEYAAEPSDTTAISENFDKELGQYENGMLPRGHRFELGMPSTYLRSAGFPGLPISMRSSLLATKAKMNRHPFEGSDLKGLVEALQKPIAIFEYSKSNMRNLIVDIKRGDKHFLVGVTLNYKAGDIEINSVSGLFPKDSLEWLKWIQDGKAIRIDQKDKVQAIIDSQRTTNTVESERIGLNLDDVAKIVESFENPTIEPEELFRPGDFSPRDKVLARDAYNRICSIGGYQFREAIQDSMLGLKKLYQAISEAEASAHNQNFRIENVAGFENAYLFENRMSSMNRGEQHEYFLRYMNPLLKEIGRIAGASERKRKELTDYMMAKHGLERNEYMRNEAAANNEETDRDFSGLTALTGEADWRDAEATARQWVDDYEKQVDTTALWEAVNKATKATLEKVYHSGIISKETYNKILGMYDFYIPLRGWDETTTEDVYGYLTRNDGPLGGSIMKRAGGRSSMADDPIATIAMMADDAIRQGNRNLMKQRFLNYILNHPSDAVSLSDVWLEYDDVADEWHPVFANINNNMTPEQVATEIEAFEQRMEKLRNQHPDKYKKGRDTQNIPYKVVKDNLREHQVLIKRNGQTFVATINGNPRAAQALNGLTNPDVDQNGVVGNMLKAGTWVNRQLSAFYTTRNPDFVAGNFFRDMLYSNLMAWVKESPRYAIQFHKNFGLVNPVKMRKLLGKWEDGTLNQNDRIENMFYQFMKNGGETGYTNVRDIDSHKKSIATELKKQTSAGRKAWAALGLQLDLLNRSAENCARFAAFMTSREFGRSVDRAIYDAKEVSVNFNKKGSGGKMVNATGQTALGKAGAYLGGGGRIAFVFWNAGIQGMTNFGRQAQRNPARFIGGATALFSLGYIIPILAEALGGGDGDDDDKNAYYNLPEYIRRSNICFRTGDQWVTIPLPIEFRAMYGLGELAHGVISGNERYSDEELAHQMAAQVSQLMPLDMLEGGGGFSALIPSAVKPLTEAYWMNKSWTGLPIYKESPFNKNDPEWAKAYASTDKHLVDFAKWLNETSGGDDFTKGAIDINPAKIEYLLNGTFGGMVSFPNKIKKTVETMAGDRDFEWRNMPLANRVIKSGDERTAFRKLQNEYFKYKEEYEETGRRLRKYQDADDRGVIGYAEKVSFLENSPEYARWEIFDEFKPDIDAYREEISGITDKTEKRKAEDELHALMRELVNALHHPKEYMENAMQQ